MSTPLLSLVVIVRDEQELIAQLLAHHRRLYDEAIVVDTGSHDRTRETAADLGARVVQRPWDDDFAAARNCGLDAARGAWILCLDADERIAGCDLARVRADLLAGESARGYLFAFRSYSPLKEHLEWQPVRGEYPEEEAGHEGFIECVNLRLFPRREDLRYQGRVHESVEPAAARLGLSLLTSRVPIHHYGLVRPAAVMSAKRELYARLVPKKWHDDPAATGARLELACKLLGTGESRRACRLLEDLAATEPPDAHVQRARLYLARIRSRMGEAAAARDLLTTVVTTTPGWPQGWIELARLLTAGRRWTELANHLRRARAAIGPHPLLLWSECYLLAATGRVATAARVGARLEATAPNWAEGRALAACLRQAARRRRLGFPQCDTSPGSDLRLKNGQELPNLSPSRPEATPAAELLPAGRGTLASTA